MNGETWIDGDGDGDCDPGERIEYIIFVLNEGTVTLDNTQFSGDLLGASWDCGDASDGSSLAPSAAMTCTGTYQVRVDNYFNRHVLSRYNKNERWSRYSHILRFDENWSGANDGLSPGSKDVGVSRNTVADGKCSSKAVF